MSLESDLDKLLEGEESIISVPILFKEKLGIGDKAYAFVRARDKLTTFTESIGIGATASGLAASHVVAGTFFAQQGILASLGLATAATPLGWVIGAGMATGAGYLALSSLLERSKDEHVIVTPKYINTPLDIIATALIEMMLPVSLKVAKADGELSSHERRVIVHNYVNRWGYNKDFITRMIQEYEEHLDDVSLSCVADSFNLYCRDNPDCDPASICMKYKEHLAEIATENGQIKQAEQAVLDEFISLLDSASEPGYFNATFENLKSGASSISSSAGAVIDKGASAISDTATAIGQAAKQTGAMAIDTSSVAADKAHRVGVSAFGIVSSRASKIYKALQEKLGKSDDKNKP